MMTFEVLILTIQACIMTIIGSCDFIEENNVIFSVSAFTKKPSCALVGGLFLFKRLYVILIPCANPLAWWQIHESQL
jgi:hypothetical protein